MRPPPPDPPPPDPTHPAASTRAPRSIFSTIQIADALAFDAAGGPKARGNQILVIEAGGHCAGGAIAWPNATWGAALANDFSLTLFADTIGAPAAATPEAAAVLAHARVSVGALRARLGAGSSIIWYILGSGAAGDIGNLWAGGTVATFTNTTTHRFYLHAGGALTPAPPTTAEAPTGWGADPDRAIPTVGGNVLTIAPCVRVLSCRVCRDGGWCRSPYQRGTRR